MFLENLLKTTKIFARGSCYAAQAGSVLRSFSFIKLDCQCFLNDGPTPASFLFIFVFSNKLFNFTIFVKKSIQYWCWDSNP